MRVLYLGSKDRGVRCLAALVESGTDVVGVVAEDEADPDAFWDGSVKEAAQRHEIDVQSPADVNSPESVDAIAAIEPQLIVLSGFSQVLGGAILEIPEKGVINLHAGKLPAYRGGSPMNWAIIEGETEAAATIHYATERIDAGDVIAEETIPIAIDDTIADLRERTLKVFPRLLVDAVEDIRRETVETRPNEPSEGAYWGSREPRDGRIDWQNMTARQVYNFVRALTHPYPGAFSIYRGERVHIWEVELLEETIRHAPGRICMRRDGGRVVAAKDKGVLVRRVAREGRGETTPADLLERGEYLE